MGQGYGVIGYVELLCGSIRAHREQRGARKCMEDIGICERCHSSQEWYTACRKGQRRHAAWWHRLKEDVGRWHGLERVMEILSSLFLPFFLPNSLSSRQVSSCC